MLLDDGAPKVETEFVGKQTVVDGMPGIPALRSGEVIAILKACGVCQDTPTWLAR
jgi:hypothetical protein